MFFYLELSQSGIHWRYGLSSAQSGAESVRGFLEVISSLFGLVEKVQTSLEGILDVRKEDPWNNKEMIFYFFIILMMFFCVADMGKFPEFWNQNP